MFPQANHDAAALQAELGDIPLAGFFAQGEIGPVGGNNFLHGLTASLITYSATYDSKTSADDSGASA
jgi:small ligand-binding sensory domain FIST